MSARLRGIPLARAYARCERVAARRIGGGLVLVPLVEGGTDLDRVCSLQGAAPFIWEQLDGRRTGDAIVDAIVERFAVERQRAASDYVELVLALERLGAVVPVRERSSLTGSPREG